MFAFTFYDSKRKTMIIARDHFGIKPLYYTSINGNLYFASEIKQLLLLDDLDQFDHAHQMIYEYMISGATDHSHQTMYSKIQQFPAAHFAEINLNDIGNDKSINFQLHKYWDLSLDKKINPSFDDAVIAVKDLFLESVKLHMRSDVPVGAALSGGIDSSAIVCAIRFLYPNQEIHSFSYIAADELSEEYWIDIVNNHIKAKAHKIKVSKEELVSDLNDLIKTQGEPFGSTSIYAQYRVFQEAKKNNIKVMLDGQGADEMLGGYIYFQSSVLAGYIMKGRFYKGYKFFNSCVLNTSSSKKYLLLLTIRELLPLRILSRVKSLFLSNKKIHWISKDWIKRNKVDHLKVYKHSLDLKHPLNSHLKSNLTKLGLPHLLRYEDRNSMRWSIESRVPFLYVELVEYLYSLPEEYLLNSDGLSKYVFREAMRGIVPDEILDRKDKVGFATPEKDWLYEMDSWVKEQLEDSKKMDFFDTHDLKKSWNDVLTGKADFDFRCWRWLNLICWQKSNDKR